ncbi:hypothetical protein BGX29_007557 [Mortierella sp. GBA35]|nr:hypothetical protein BGX29_007557 [Mortierella sp. GBA35]
MEVQEQTDTQPQDSQDWEWVEETEYIVLDFGGSNLDATDMEQLISNGYSLVGLDTPTPYFKCGGYVFKGIFDENAFTEDLIFNMKAREDGEEAMEDDDEEYTDALDLTTITTKRVIFDPVELVRNNRPVQDPDFPETEWEKRDDDEEEDQQEDDEVSITTPVDPKEHLRGTTQSIWKAARQAAGMSVTMKNNRIVGTNTVVKRPPKSKPTRSQRVAEQATTAAAQSNDGGMGSSGTSATSSTATTAAAAAATTATAARSGESADNAMELD